jgi:hypothetical protein
MKKKKATLSTNRAPKRAPSGKERPRRVTKPALRGLTPQQVLDQAGVFANDPDFVPITNQVYLETRGRLCFDNHDPDLHSRH